MCGSFNSADLLRVTNIKFRFKAKPFGHQLRTFCPPAQDVKVKQHERNYITVRTTKCCYIPYESGTVNCCGVKSLTELDAAVEHFFDLFPSHRTAEPELVIDNISLTGQVEGGSISHFSRFLDSLEQRWGYRYSYNSHRFTGAAIKCPFGVVVLFPSSKLNVVGLKAMGDLRLVRQWLREVAAFRLSLGLK